MQVCFETLVGGLPITLSQTSKGLFAVQYWKQRKSGLTYAAAARELGECIMHAAACNGALDNEGD